MVYSIFKLDIFLHDISRDICLLMNKRNEESKTKEEKLDWYIQLTQRERECWTVLCIDRKQEVPLYWNLIIYHIAIESH